MSWEAWGTPPDPEPNPCPMCEGELGCMDDCELCKAVDMESKAKTALYRLKTTLAHRLRIYMNCKTDAERAEAFTLLAGISSVLSPHEIDAAAVAAAEKKLLTFDNARYIYPPKKESA